MYICNHSAQEVEEGRQTFKTNMGKKQDSLRNKPSNGADEMARQIKGLPHKQDSLSLDPLHPHNCWADLAPWRWKLGVPRNELASLD